MKQRHNGKEVKQFLGDNLIIYKDGSLTIKNANLHNARSKNFKHLSNFKRLKIWQ